MRTRNLILILILLGVGLFVVMDQIAFHTRGKCVWDSEPTRQDSSVHVPAVGKDCSGLGLDFDILEGRFRTWRNQQLCENWSDIRIVFDNKEFLFSYEEFKAVIEASVPQQHFDNYDLSQ